MIKGINRQVVEVNETECEYFEKILFFVKPEFAQISEGKIRERAHLMALGAGSPPPTRIKKRKIIYYGKIVSSAVIGAALTSLIFILITK